MNRLRRYLQNLAALPANLLAPANDPRQSATGMAQRQEQALLLVQRTLAELQTTTQQLRARVALLRLEAGQLEQQARLAVAAGHEDTARRLLERCYATGMAIQALEQQLGQIAQQAEQLALSEQRLRAEIQAFRARLEVIAARHSAVEAQARGNQAVSRALQEVGDLSQVLAQVEQRAAEVQAQTALVERMIDAGLLPDSDADDHFFNHRLNKLGEQRFVDEQIAVLRATVRDNA